MSDTPMNYYEELGLTASASEEDIRRAHRNLSRILHPDQQTEESLRRTAEVQMCRVNALVDILLDPQRRQRYDQSLQPGVPAPASSPYEETATVGFSILRLAGIVIAAVMVTLLAIWLVGGDFIHWGGITLGGAAGEEQPPALVRPPPVAEGRQDVPAGTGQETARHGAGRGTKAAALSAKGDESTIVTGTPVPEGKRPAPAPAPFVPMAYVFHPLTVLPPPAVPGVARGPVEEPWVVSKSAFAGLWLLPSTSKLQTSKVLRQAPQYIQVKISGANESLWGEYSARYETPDLPISPEVDFTFLGPAEEDSAVFNWTAADGSRGGIELKLLTPRSMQVTWHVTEFGSSMGITGGAAVVIRRMD